jgi:uncharacterized protein YcnI
MNKKITALAMTGFFLMATSASAHVVVKPSEVNVATFQSFSIGVPVEKDMPTVGVRLVLPQGLSYVTPNVKSGWKIAIKKDGESVTEINWTGGSIPTGQRDDFTFSAKVPATETSLQWKAYQTYQDGTVISWDADPSAQSKNADGKDDFSKSGPFSTTQVINDLKPEKKVFNISLLFSIIAIGLASTALARPRNK